VTLVKAVRISLDHEQRSFFEGHQHCRSPLKLTVLNAPDTSCAGAAEAPSSWQYDNFESRSALRHNWRPRRTDKIAALRCPLSPCFRSGRACPEGHIRDSARLKMSAQCQRDHGRIWPGRRTIADLLGRILPEAVRESGTPGVSGSRRSRIRSVSAPNFSAW
jgi:hypothetical protein